MNTIVLATLMRPSFAHHHHASENQKQKKGGEAPKGALFANCRLRGSATSW
jgi:hypothetical protein